MGSVYVSTRKSCADSRKSAVHQDGRRVQMRRPFSGPNSGHIRHETAGNGSDPHAYLVVHRKGRRPVQYAPNSNVLRGLQLADFSPGGHRATRVHPLLPPAPRLILIYMSSIILIMEHGSLHSQTKSSITVAQAVLNSQTTAR